MTDRETFKRAFDLLGEERAAYDEDCAALNVELDEAHRAAFRAAFPKSKLDLVGDGWRAKVCGKLGPEAVEAIRLPLQARYDERSRQHDARKKTIEAVLDKAARGIPLASPATGGERVKIEEAWGLTYSTQGFGAGAYAKARAELAEIEAHACGLTRTEIDVKSYPPNPHPSYTTVNRAPDYLVFAWVSDPLDVEIMRRKPGEGLRALVAACWRKQVNPRVYMPFLPHGFEEKQGLDYQGRDLPWYTERQKAKAAEGAPS